LTELDSDAVGLGFDFRLTVMALGGCLVNETVTRRRERVQVIRGYLKICKMSNVLLCLPDELGARRQRVNRPHGIASLLGEESTWKLRLAVNPRPSGTC